MKYLLRLLGKLPDVTYSDDYQFTEHDREFYRLHLVVMLNLFYKH